MGTCNMLKTRMVCPRCGVSVEVEIEMEFGDTRAMAAFAVGDCYAWVPGKAVQHGGRPENGDLDGEGYAECPHCRRDFFVKVLAVEDKDADDAACQMEHSIPGVILERFIQFAEFVEVCPRGGAKWISGFGYHCDHGGTEDNCERCIAKTLDEVKQRRQKGDRSMMATATLRDLKPGQKGKVLKIKAHGAVSKRIVEMGVTPGAVIEVEHIAPFGDPIDIKVKGYHLSLRKDEIEGIEIELL